MEIDYERVFQASPSPCLLLTPDLVIVAANQAAQRTSGLSGGDLLGRKLFDVSPGNPIDPEGRGHDELRASFQRVLETGEQDTVALIRNDVEVPGKPGVFEQRYWNHLATPILGPDGRVQLIRFRTDDVTPFITHLGQLQQEGDVADKRAQLHEAEKEVYLRARELQDLNERLRVAHAQQVRMASALRQAVERQRRFVSEASHDLRNPITGLQIQLEDALADPDADPQQVLNALLRDTQRLNDLIADLLELTRLDAGTHGPAELIDLGQLVTEELKRQHLNAVVRPRLEPGVVVHASRIRLARLLDNLLANADRHAVNEIRVVVTTDAADAVLEVIDDGRGIPDHERERIFERFYRSAASRRSHPHGTGLGLPICREIAKAYGGRLYAADNCPGAHLILRLSLATQTRHRDR